MLLFYQNFQKRNIELDIKDEKIYLGSDMRMFNKDLINNNLTKLYKEILKQMAIGFDEIIVDAKDYEKAINITKFLCIFGCFFIFFVNLVDLFLKNI